MLLEAVNMRQLDLHRLMEVYVEGNRENGADNWPEESTERQLQLAEEVFQDYLCLDFFATPGAVYDIWVVDTHYVSALRLEPYKDGLLLEALETAPAFRRRGHGEALMRAVLARQQGKIYSHVHKGNAPSLALHKKCGFRRTSETAAYIDGSVNDRCCTMLYFLGEKK